jgi:hypothetical protein
VNVFNLLIIQCLSVNRFYSFGSPSTPALPPSLWEDGRTGAKSFSQFACCLQQNKIYQRRLSFKRARMSSTQIHFFCQKHTKNGLKWLQLSYPDALV